MVQCCHTLCLHALGHLAAVVFAAFLPEKEAVVVWKDFMNYSGCDVTHYYNFNI